MSRYDAVTDSAGRRTFWWAFTTAGNALRTDEQLTVANHDGGTRDGLILRNQTTGKYRFKKVRYASGYLAAGPSTVVAGQLPVTTDTGRLYVGHLKPAVNEPGGTTRDDTFFVDLAAGTLRRTSARWDPATSRYSYWWAFTKPLPSLHQGFPGLRRQPWALLRCKFSDVTSLPKSDSFYRQAFLTFGAGGVADYFRDISYGSVDITGSYLAPWRTITHSVSDSEGRGGSLSRNDAIDACVAAHGVDPADYGNRVLVLFNAGDSYTGAASHGALVDPDNYAVTVLAHEMLHVYGLPHSFDDTTNQRCSTWCAAPGEYLDQWDGMSSPGGYEHTRFNSADAGPELNAAFKQQLGWLPSSRVRALVPGTTRQTTTVRLAGLNRPEADGSVMVRVDTGADLYYTVELRHQSEWDSGIPEHAVLVHQVKGGATILQTTPQRSYTAGETFSDTRVTVRVDRIDVAHSTATVTITY